MLAAFLSVITAAPHNGELIMLSQPDGSEVPVHIFGDEMSAAAECPNGYTLVRAADGWIYYAELSADGSELISTGMRYTGSQAAPSSVRKGLRINERANREKRERNRRNLGDGEEESMRGFRGKFGARSRGRANHFEQPVSVDGELEIEVEFPQHAPNDEQGYMPAPGDTTRIVGMVLFIAFPDYPAPTDGAFLRHADSAYNRRNFRGNGSVLDYFDRVSGGNVQYTNYVTAWVTAPNNFQYYDGVDNYGRVQELIEAALRQLANNTAVANQIGSQVTTYNRNWGGSVGTQRTAMALNIHPIRSGQRWSHGIWSHRGWFRNGNLTVGGIRFYDYQFTGLGDGTLRDSRGQMVSISLGTVAHENGHMLFDWPDLYPYVSGQRNWVSTYCIMSSSSSPPQMPNPYFRMWAASSAKIRSDWDIVTNITNMNAVLTANVNANASYRYVRNAQESYFIEARNQSLPSGNIPGSGLIIWHVDTRGDNANYSTTETRAARRIPMVAVVQANSSTQIPTQNPTANAPFRAGDGSNATAFHSGTTPAARWHAFNSNNVNATSPYGGDLADIRITEVSTVSAAANSSMTFRIGTGSNTPALTITTSSLPNATVGTAYSQTLAAAGGSGAVTWARTAGNLPTGLTLNAAGTISGTPTATGTFTFTVSATNSVSAARELTIIVAAGIPTITTTSTLPGATVGVAYSQTLEANTHGGGAITWAIATGTLPAGLTLSNAGVISGTPTTAGQSNFTVRATNSAGNATRQLSITVTAPTPVTFTVTFNANYTGGTVTPATAQTGTDGKLTSLPVPTRANFAFNGWFTATTGSTEITLDRVYTVNTTIYARWSQIRTVTFNPNGGTVTPTTAQTGVNGRLTLDALPVPTRDGYTFNGWFTTATSNVAVTLDRSYNANATVVAQWTALPTYTVIFDPNGGTVTPTSGTTGTDGRLTSLPVPERTGFNFDGWFTDATDGAEITTDVEFTEDAVIFAQWTVMLPTYTITFNANGGAVEPETATTETNGRLSTLPVPERDGFSFTGWFVDVSDAAGITANYVFTADMTVTAKWSSSTSVLSPDRNPVNVNPKDEVEFFAPATVFAGEFTAGPNPVNKQSGVVNFFWQGRKIESAALTVFDASGNVVNRVTIKDSKDGRRRVVGSWDLTDRKGRTVGAGTYLVNGVVTVDGKKEKVSVILGVR